MSCISSVLNLSSQIVKFFKQTNIRFSQNLNISIISQEIYSKTPDQPPKRPLCYDLSLAPPPAQPPTHRGGPDGFVWPPPPRPPTHHQGQINGPRRKRHNHLRICIHLRIRICGAVGGNHGWPGMAIMCGLQVRDAVGRKAIITGLSTEPRSH